MNGPCVENHCHLCCLNTEMELTTKDIERLKAAGRRDFHATMDGSRRLLNRNGRCVFLSPAGLCSAYDTRPEGCRHYPWIYDATQCRIVLDTDCPGGGLFDPPDTEGIMLLVNTLEMERGGRSVITRCTRISP